jgi:hypothetical protein
MGSDGVSHDGQTPFAFPELRPAPGTPRLQHSLIKSTTLMSSPFLVWRCVGWKVSTDGHAVVDQTACRSWRSGIVVDPWGRRRVRRSRFESGHQHHVQLLAGGVGDQCAIAASRRGAVLIADGTGHAAWIPRIVAGSAPADNRRAGEQATISAVLSAVRRSCPASCQHLQQLLRTARLPRGTTISGGRGLFGAPGTPRHSAQLVVLQRAEYGGR